MIDRTWEIGICGTFDVANYGDLLFPLMAASELTERLGRVNLHRFSYHAKTPPDWAYEVTSIAALPQKIQQLDGLLIGGGFLIRFDKDVAPGYVPPTPEIHHPTGYWLTPALIALQHDIPLVWNAPGMHCNDIPEWAKPMVQTALSLSRYVSVRDEQTRSALQPLSRGPIHVVPDTAFRIPRLLDPGGTPSVAFTRICEASGLNGPYVVLQATFGLEGFVRFIKSHAERFRNLRFLALPMGPVLGECQELIDFDLPGLVRLPEWPGPLVIAELIGRSEAVVGHSYHLFITALASGVPIFTPQDLSTGKYSALRQFDSIFALPPGGEPDVEWFLSRAGRTAPSAAVRATCEPIGNHWDRIAAAIQAESVSTAPALNQLWQSLPTVLEDAAIRADKAVHALANERAARQDWPDEAKAELAVARQQAAAHQDRLDDALTRLRAARVESAARETRIAEIMASASWRLTSPLRFAGRYLQKPGRGKMINLERIVHHQIATDPYRWAAIDDLFSPPDAMALARTYPCDHFKLVAASGGEKDYEYEARGLIGMGANFITYPDDLSDAWQTLAGELLSPEYRDAMVTLTGCDLTQALMEVNVFHYGPGGTLGAHCDLPEKLLTHVLYFNRSWNSADGGCLSILRSSDPADLVAEIPPIVGSSAVIVRSENSWHAVSRVVSDSAFSRRSVTVTFYRPGSTSSMWPPDDPTPLHRYDAPDLG